MYRLEMFPSNVLRGKFGGKSEGVARSRRKLNRPYDEPQYVYTSSD
jgi:hypothetical protein